MRTRALALPTIALVTALTLLPTLSHAQYRPPPRIPTLPTNPVNPGTHRPEPAPIVIPTPSVSGAGPSETMVFNPNGSITIIHQSGSDIFVTTY